MTESTDTDGERMTQDEIWDALEELHGDGLIDHVPGIGSDVDPAFTLNEQGSEFARDMLQENEDALLYLTGIVLKQAEPFDSEKELARELIEFAEWINEDAGINVLRVINENIGRVPFLTAELPEQLVEYYDEEETDD